MTATGGNQPFADALTGSDGMADPPPPPLAGEWFTDALAAPARDATPRIALPQIPVPPSAAQITADWAPGVPEPVASPIRPDARAARPAQSTAPQRAMSAAPPRADQPPDHRSRLREAVAAFSAPEWAPPSVGQLPPGVPHHGMVQISAPSRPPVRPAPRTATQRPATQPRPAGSAPAPRPAAQYRPARPQQQRKSRGGGFIILFVILLVLVMSSAGREILDVIADFLNR